jgi:hypothetical protein
MIYLASTPEGTHPMCRLLLGRRH